MPRQKTPNGAIPEPWRRQRSRRFVPSAQGADAAVLGLRGVMGSIWTEADKGPALRSFRRVGAADGKSKCILSEMG